METSYAICGQLARQAPPSDQNEIDRIKVILSQWNTCPIEDIYFVKEALGIDRAWLCRPADYDPVGCLIVVGNDGLEVHLAWQTAGDQRANIPPFFNN
jgi:hypothetical protein